MANPNIVNVTSIYGNTGYVIPSSANTNTMSWTYNGTTTLTGLTPASGTVNKIDQIVVANRSGLHPYMNYGFINSEETNQVNPGA